MQSSPWMLMHSMSQNSRVKGKKLQPQTLRRVLRYAKPYRRKLVVFVIAVAAASAVAVVPPLLLRDLLDVAIPNHNGGLVMWLALAAVGVALMDAVLNLYQRWLAAQIGEGLIYDMRTQLFDHVQRMPIAFFTRTQTGALISRMNNDVIGAQRAVTTTLSQILSNVIGVTATLVVMFALSVPITLIALVVVPIFIFAAKYIGRKLRAVTLESMNLDSGMNTLMTERLGVSGALLVKLFGQADADRDEFADRAGRVRDIGILSAIYARGFFVILALVAALVTAAVYWIGGMSAINGSMKVGTIAALTLYLAQLYMPLTALTNARVDYLSAMVSFERVFEVLDLDQEIKERPDSQTLSNIRGDVQFDHVSFSYPKGGKFLESLGDVATPKTHDEGREVLSDVAFEIQPGALCALVGPSGAGKTTVSMLLPRLYDVTSGAIKIDGVDVRDLSFASLNRAIGVVTQDPHLFHVSIAENLRFARPDATEAELEAACRVANIHHVIAALPDGYDTVVGERGYRLSGGEKQRVAIARMLLKDPAIVILDEATSHLDSESEHLIQEAFDVALRGRSSLVIAHRLSTIMAADRILVLDQGRIVESGTHAQLLGQGGLYADLFNTQFLTSPAKRAAGP